MRLSFEWRSCVVNWHLTTCMNTQQRAAKAFGDLWEQNKDDLAFVYHRKPHGRHTLRAFHPGVLLSVVIQTLASEDENCGWPLFVDVGKDRYRALSPVDLPWLHALQLMLARPMFPLNATPPTFTFRFFGDAEVRGMIVADPLPVEIAEHKPRPPRKNKDAKNCFLLLAVDEYTSADSLVDKKACLFDTDE